MKKIIATIIAAAVLLFGVSALAGEPLKLVYFDKYEPFSFYAKNGPMKGILIDIAEEALEKRMGIPLSHLGFPWARAQKMVARGMAEAFITVPTPARREYTVPSRETVVEVKNTIFVNREYPYLESLRKVEKIGDLAKFEHVQYLGNGWAEKNLEGMNVYWVSGFDKVLKILSGRSENIFIEGSSVVNYNLRNSPYKKNIIEVNNAVAAAPFHLCIRKDSEYVSILPEFDKIMRQIKKDGTLQAIKNRYK